MELGGKSILLIAVFVLSSCFENGHSADNSDSEIISVFKQADDQLQKSLRPEDVERNLSNLTEIAGKSNKPFHLALVALFKVNQRLVESDFKNAVVDLRRCRAEHFECENPFFVSKHLIYLARIKMMSEFADHQQKIFPTKVHARRYGHSTIQEDLRDPISDLNEAYQTAIAAGYHHVALEALLLQEKLARRYHATDAAIEYLKLAINCAPMAQKFAIGTSIVHLNILQGDFPSAKAELLEIKSLLVRPSDRYQFDLLMAEIQLGQGDDDAASRTLARVENFRKNLTRVSRGQFDYLSARVKSSQGDSEAAEKLMTSALRSGGRWNHKSVFYAQQIFHQSGNASKAARILEEVIERNLTFPYVALIASKAWLSISEEQKDSSTTKDLERTIADLQSRIEDDRTFYEYRRLQLALSKNRDRTIIADIDAGQMKIAQLQNRFWLAFAAAILVVTGGVFLYSRFSFHRNARKLDDLVINEKEKLNRELQEQMLVQSKLIQQGLETRQEENLNLERQRRTDILGKLTGGIAHDFNNLLFIIQQATDNLRSRYGEKLGSDGVGLLDETEMASSVGKEVVNCLLTFARDQELCETELELNSFVDLIAPLLQRICGPEIDISYEIAPAPVMIKVDRGLLTTSIINLCVNARDSIIDQDGNGAGAIEFAAYVSKDDSQMLAISVTDNGHGITEDELALIREPFYSTKKNFGHSGHGMGLSMVSGFVEQSGGRLEIESHPGQGTKATMMIPRLLQLKNVGKAPECTDDFQGRSVLLVDDNLQIRKVMVLTLEEFGFDVFTAVCHDEAKACFETGLKIDLLISDINLGGEKNGIELCRWANKQAPETVTMLISGDRPQSIPAGCVYLPKPFKASELRVKISQLLAKDSSRLENLAE